MARPTLKKGSIFGQHYRVLSTLGKGAMGHVVQVEDTRNPKQKLALKLLHGTDSRWLARFQQEFSLLATSTHPNIVRVYDFGLDTQSDTPFYTADLVKGEALDLSDRHWKEEQLIDLLVQAARALQFLHTRRILHGDVKPGNILAPKKGNRFILVDLGLATAMDKPDRGHIGGTLRYMAPETLKGGAIDIRSDLYSLGMTIYRLATTQEPFPNKIPPVQSLRSYRDDISEGFDEIVRKLLEWNPDVRFHSAKQVIQAINRILNRSFPLETTQTLQAYSTSPKLIGRSRLLNALLDQLSFSLESNAKPFSSLLASPGMGKSRLLHEVRRSLQLRGKPVTLLSCNRDTSAFSVLEKLARNLLPTVHHISQDARSRRISSWLQGTTGLKSAEAEETEIRDIVEDLTHWIFKTLWRKGHALLLDDVDLIENDEQTYLRSFFARMADESEVGLAIIVSMEHESPFLCPPNLFNPIDLKPFTEKEVRSYFEFFQIDLHPQAATALRDKTAGNPFLLETVTQELLSKNVRSTNRRVPLRFVQFP